MKRFTFKSLILLTLLALAFSGTAFSAGGLTTGDQTITGQKTFEHAAVFNKSVTFKGPILGAGVQTGNVFYVDDSGANSPGNYGKTYDKPFATIDFAIGQCTANHGDIIYVLAGHNEGITGAGEIDVDVAGVSIIGLGSGEDKPTIDFDHANASVVLGANSTSLVNLRFRTSANAVVVGVDVEDGVTGWSVLGCEFGWAETATDEFAIALRSNDASNRGLVEGCTFQAGAQAAAIGVYFLKDTDGTIVRDNLFTGTYSTAPVAGLTTASTNLVIDGNKFFTQGTADTFNLVAASTGIVCNNYLVMNAVSAAAALDIGNCMSIENYVIADDDVGGTKASINAEAFASVTGSADD